MADGLFMPDGTFRAFGAAELSCELATRQNAGVYAGELEGWLSILPDPDPVLRKRGDEAVILADLSADDQVTTAMLSRKNRVLNCPHLTFRAGAPEGEAPTPEAENLHRRFMRDLEHTNLRTVISGILDAPFYDFTPLEILWRFTGDWWHIADIVPRPYHWFRFENIIALFLWVSMALFAQIRAYFRPASLYLLPTMPHTITPMACVCFPAVCGL